MILPSLFMGLTGISSFGVAMMPLCFAYLLFLLSRFELPVRLSRTAFLAVIAALCSVFTTGVLAFSDIDQRQAVSCVALLIALPAVYDYVHRLTSISLRRFKATVLVAYFTLCVIGIAGVVGVFQPGLYRDMNYPVFPFLEPSHFALSFALVTCLAMSVVEGGARYALVAVSFAMSMLFPNLTLLVVSCLELLLLARGTVKSGALIAAIVTGAATFIVLDPSVVPYWSGRLAEGEAGNISRLVYFQGLDSMLIAGDVTHWLGLGFQNLGKEPDGPSAILLDNMGVQPQNRLDGGFIAAKVVAEFGILGILACIFVLRLWYLSLVALRRHIRGESASRVTDPSTILSLCSAYTFIIEFAVRGSGYFSPTCLIYLCVAPAAWKAAWPSGGRRAPVGPSSRVALS